MGQDENDFAPCAGWKGRSACMVKSVPARSAFAGASLRRSVSRRVPKAESTRLSGVAGLPCGVMQCSARQGQNSTQRICGRIIAAQRISPRSQGRKYPVVRRGRAAVRRPAVFRVTRDRKRRVTAPVVRRGRAAVQRPAVFRATEPQDLRDRVIGCVRSAAAALHRTAQSADRGEPGCSFCLKTRCVLAGRMIYSVWQRLLHSRRYLKLKTENLRVDAFPYGGSFCAAAFQAGSCGAAREPSARSS